MSMGLVRILRGWMLWIMAVLLIGSVGAWFLTRDVLPARIRIAAGQPSGAYQRYATELGRVLIRRGRQTAILATGGTKENVSLMRNRDADLGIMQAGTDDVDGMVVIAPLLQEVVHVIVRQSSSIASLDQLRDHRVAVGLQGSGMRSSSLQVLKHYRLTGGPLKTVDVHFSEMLDDDTLDAAIVTTGIDNPQLIRLLETQKFSLLPIEDSGALALKHPHFVKFEIPRGLYHEGPPIPGKALSTVATTAFLACRADTKESLVSELLTVLYDYNLHETLPGLMSPHQVLESTRMRWHPVARAYFDPFDQLGFTANLMESLAAFKELLVALGAAIFLLWERWRRLHQAAHQAEMMKLKERLDEFLTQTIAIEQQLLGAPTAVRLQELLDEVSQVKLQALQELTHEDLRGDRMFSIFLLQCGNLSQSLQGKLWLARSAERFPD